MTHAAGAVDPSAADSGTPSTRVKNSSSSYTKTGAVDQTAPATPTRADKERDSMSESTVPETTIPAPFAIRYTLTVWIEVPCDEEGWPAYAGNELERAVIHHLRKLDGDVDCELMETVPVPIECAIGFLASRNFPSRPSTMCCSLPDGRPPTG